MFDFAMDPFPRAVLSLSHQFLEMQRRFRPPADVWPTPTRTARRCLFGVADPAVTRTDLNRVIREEAERCIDKWDFNPRTGKPVENPKRYKWEKVACEGPRATSPPADAAPVAEKGSGVEDDPNPAEQADSPVFEASFPAREGDDGGRVLEPRLQDEGAAINSVEEEVDRSRAARRFAPYRQNRITDYYNWRKKKSFGEAKERCQAPSDVTGPSLREAAETEEGDDAH